MVLASWTPCTAVCHTLPPSSCSNRSSGLSEQLVKSSTVNCFQAGKLADCHCHDSRAYTLSLSLHIVFNYILTFALSLTVYPCHSQKSKTQAEAAEGYTPRNATPAVPSSAMPRAPRPLPQPHFSPAASYTWNGRSRRRRKRRKSLSRSRFRSRGLTRGYYLASATTEPWRHGLGKHSAYQLAHPAYDGSWSVTLRIHGPMAPSRQVVSTLEQWFA